MGELIEKYPSQVVLGCLYSGVPTPFVKPAGASAFPPFLYHDGFSLEASINSKKFHYPESPTYPLLSYGDGKYLGRMGSLRFRHFVLSTKFRVGYHFGFHQWEKPMPIIYSEENRVNLNLNYPLKTSVKLKN